MLVKAREDLAILRIMRITTENIQRALLSKGVPTGVNTFPLERLKKRTRLEPAIIWKGVCRNGGHGYGSILNHASGAFKHCFAAAAG